MELTILLPCLNEAQTLARCISKAQACIQRLALDAEVLVADNGSSDGSQAIAAAHGARVIDVPTRGYGAALIAGMAAARGRFVIMGDADDSYDFAQLDGFIEALRGGAQLVMGNRFRGGIAPGAMPPLHRYLGNPVLSALGRLLFHSGIGDFHCGLRGVEREAMLALSLQASGMEFASEMVVKATVHGLRLAEVPTTLSRDGRDRPSHLRSWRDGWRHLRLLLLYSPRWLFLYPGLALTAVGVLGLLWLWPQQRQLGGVVLGVHTLLFAGVATVLGVQAASFAIFAKVSAIQAGLLLRDTRIAWFTQQATVERGLIGGVLLIVVGLVGSSYALMQWGAAGFGPLGPDSTMRVVIPSATAILVGVQMALAAFFLEVLQLGKRPTA